mmetsp:Transcript_22983/g.66575  ORF Transcript_22983/g.66575 Transcript_22983/m.66575 type:complete len:201 (+) Transcript_22983:156-758(+)
MRPERLSHSATNERRVSPRRACGRYRAPERAAGESPRGRLYGLALSETARRARSRVNLDHTLAAHQVRMHDGDCRGTSRSRRSEACPHEAPLEARVQSRRGPRTLVVPACPDALEQSPRRKGRDWLLRSSRSHRRQGLLLRGRGRALLGEPVAVGACAAEAGFPKRRRCGRGRQRPIDGKGEASRLRLRCDRALPVVVGS